MKTFNEFIQENMGTTFGEYPYQYNTVDNPTDRGQSGNVEFNQTNNQFQSIQDEIKNIIITKNPKWDKMDIEKRLQEFFQIGGNKLEKIRTISDNCKDIKKCAKEIYDKYIQNVKINSGENDSVNDVQQDSIMEDLNDKTGREFDDEDKDELIVQDVDEVNPTEEREKHETELLKTITKLLEDDY